MAQKEFSLPDVDSIDEVPEDFRPFYFEKDGKVQRQNPQAMVSTMAKIRRENERMSAELLEREERLQSFIDVLGDDADPAVIKSLKDKAAKAEQLPTNEEVEKRIRLMEENFSKQAEILKKEKATYERAIEREAVRAQIRAALQAADANNDGMDILPDILRPRVEKIINDDGSIKLIPLDEDGTKMYTADGSEATLLDLANQIKDKRPIFFNGSRASGVGSNGESITLPKDAKDWYKMSPAEKTEFRKKHGRDAANALMAKSAAARSL